MAVSSADGLFSSPLDTIANGESAITETLVHLTAISPIEVYVGLPLNLKGDHTKSTELALEFAKELSSKTEVPVRMVDERLTTRSAQSQLNASGKNGRTSKAIIDAAAASLILESALAFEKSTGKQPGKSIEESDA